MNSRDEHPHARTSEPAGFRSLPTGSTLEVPHSEDSELNLLSCAFADEGKTVARALREKISADAFYFPATKTIWETMVMLHRRGVPITVETVTQELVDLRLLDGVGGWSFVMRVSKFQGTTAHAHYFIEKVIEKWVLRRLHRYAHELLEGIHEYTGANSEQGRTELEILTGKWALSYGRLADFVLRRSRPSQEDEVKEANEELARIMAGKVDKSRQLKRGLPYADSVFLPYDVRNEDWMIVIAGSPSSGKSSRVREIVRTNCAEGKRFAVFLLETGARRWRWALPANIARVSLKTVLEEPGRLLPDERKRWDEAHKVVTSWTGECLWVYEDLYAVEDIERTVRELDRSLRERDIERGVPPEKVHGLDGYVVDYLQLASTREKIRMREEQVAYMSKTFKRLSKSLDITGFILSQLNRKSRDEERRPRASDLRESGAIEQDADGIELIYRPPNDKSGAPQTGDRNVVEQEIIQAKRRNGPADLVVEVLFHRSHTRFADADRIGAPRPGMPKNGDGYKRPE